MPASLAWNLADLFEIVVDTLPGRVALVAGDARLTYRALDDRANRLAHHLAAAGVGPGDPVGIYSWNRAEWLEAMFAAWKIRAVPINLNYRYVADEARYILDNADVVALVHERAFAPLLAGVAPSLPKLRHFVVLEDGSRDDDGAAACARLEAVPYEDALAGASPARDFPARSSDDLYVLYTGGTTGTPKGVVWRHEDIFFAAMGGGGFGKPPIRTPEELAERVAPDGVELVGICNAPMMHGGGQWVTCIAFFAGNTCVLNTSRHFDADEVWRLAEREHARSIMVVGDAMARPLVEALSSPGTSYDTSAIVAVGSGGAILSAAVKEQLREKLPQAVVMDSFGASETGAAGSVMDLDGPAAGPRFTMGEFMTVLDDELVPVTPGSGTVGRLARSGHIPLGYHKDDAKTAATFLTTADGRRWVVPGDYATIEADGTITLLGRGSVCINSGGEKIYPEEVEAALKSHPDVFDAIVVGVPDDRFVERVAAIVQPRPGARPTLAGVQEHCRDKLAGFKVPRQLVVLDEIVRTPVGKPDYRWAKTTAISSGRSRSGSGGSAQRSSAPAPALGAPPSGAPLPLPSHHPHLTLTEGFHMADLGFWSIAAADPDHLAIAEADGREVRAGELLASCNQLVQGLRALGLQRGDAIAMVLPNSVEVFELYLAVLQAGWYLVPINFHLVGPEIAYIVADSEAKVFVTHERFADIATAAVDELDFPKENRFAVGDVAGFRRYDELKDGQPATLPDDRTTGAVMNYTSGTTGRPKGVRRKLPGIEPEAMGIGFGGMLLLFGLQPHDDNVHICGSPLYHTAVLVFAGGALHMGFTVVLMDKWMPEGMLALIDKYRVTNSHMVPTQFHRLLALPDDVKAKYDVSSLRTMVHAAAPCPPDVKRRMIEWWGPVIDEYYAASEGGGTLVRAAEWLEHPGTVGRAWPNAEIVILDDAGNELGPNEVGTVYMHMATGDFEYFKDKEKTDRSRVGKFFTVGDIGVLDEDGWLFLRDRKADMIISGGANIYPAEIESVLLSHPKVGDAAVFGIPHEDWGEEVKAVVEPAPGVEPGPELAADILAFCADKLAKFKTPKSIDFIEEMPRDPNGKLYKRKLRDPYWEGRERAI